MKIVLIHRSKKLGYHSIENVFASIQEELKYMNEVESVYVENPGFSIANLFALRKYSKTCSAETLFHITGDIHYVVFALPRKRTILTIHDCVFIKQKNRLRRWLLKKLYLDWAVWYVRAITAISEKTKNEIVALTGCNPDKIRVINNPVASHIRYTEKAFSGSNPVLLFIGSDPNKNLNRVIEALTGFCCTLHIVGKINEQQLSNLYRYNIRHIIENNLLNEEIAERYERADIILFPSLYEGFGLPVIEGFKAGRAVLTSDKSPMKEVSDGAAWLVDPYSPISIRSALERIVQDSEMRKKKIQNGLRIVQQYLPANVASLYAQSYMEVAFQNSTVTVS